MKLSKENCKANIREMGCRVYSDTFEECKKTPITEQEEDQLPSSYFEQRIFWLLLPALEETLIEASKWNALQVQKCRFNGLDYIAELLWNRNPRRSKIHCPPLNVFEIPLFQRYLLLHPRPYYPKSWLWTEDEAALHIQRYVRGWLVKKREDVQEMRQFWKNVAGKNLAGKLYQLQGTSVGKQNEENLIRCKKYRSKFDAHLAMQNMGPKNVL